MNDNNAQGGDSPTSGGRATNRQRRWSDGVAPAPQSDPGAPWSMSSQWPSLVATLSEQAMESTNVALRGLDFLVGAGRLRPAESKALADTLQRLRDVSLRAQQITRLASGRIRQAKDRVELAGMIEGLLAERKAEFESIGAEVGGEFMPVDVLLDPPVAVTLINTIIDWALVFSRHIQFTLLAPQWPAPSQLVVRVRTSPPAGAAPATSAPGAPAKDRGRRLNDGLHWMLLRQMASSAGLSVARSGGDGVAILTVEFHKTFKASDGVSTVELFSDADPHSYSLQDIWVLVVVQDVNLRAAAVDALRLSGIATKAAGNISDARVIASMTRPDAIVVAFDTHGEFDLPRAEALGCDDRCPLVEIVKVSPSFHTLGFEGWEVAKVGRDEVAKELAPAVLFELAKMA